MVGMHLNFIQIYCVLRVPKTVYENYSCEITKICQFCLFRKIA